MKRITLSLVGFILAAGMVTLTIAEEFNPSEAVKNLDSLERKLSSFSLDEHETSEWVKKVENARSKTNNCITTTEAQIAVITDGILKLGDESKNEPAEVKKKRADLNKDKADKEKELASCRLVNLRADELLKLLSDYQQSMLAKRLLAVGPTFFELFDSQWELRSEWVSATWSLLIEDSGLHAFQLKHAFYLLLLNALSVLAGLYLRKRMQHFSDTHVWDKSYSATFTHALINTYSIFVPYLLASLAISSVFLSVTLEMKPKPLSTLIMIGLPIYIGLLSLAQFVFAPSRDSALLLNLLAPISRRISYRFKVLATLLFIAFILFASIVKQSLSNDAINFVRGFFAIALVINLSWTTWLLGYLPRSSGTLWLRVIVQVSLIIILVAELAGYRNLSFQVLLGVFGSLLAFGIYSMLSKLAKDFFDGIEYGRQAWHRKIRRGFSLKSGDHFPGLLWFQAIVFVGLWVSFAIALLRIWGMSDADMAEYQSYVINGFTVGSLEIVPARIIIALLSFGLLVALSSWLKNYLDRQWLAKTKIDRGSREAIVIISGYSGMTVAFLVGLGVAGVEFKNLAIVAGALSVGIGFGLQNIVNNFVSGLILLFERPIRRGDWIVVGNTEGYVKRIRIRSTQIETFDHADVIVPNSELISTQVTNWMLSDQQGRARVPVGVAYGSDTEKVKAILLQVAEEHDLVISNDEKYPSRVLFMGFGDSALNFELRVYIKNVDQRLRVISDLNFTIDRKFRENGVEIPFPKRDLYIKEMPGKE